MNRDRIVDALNSDFRQMWLSEVPIQGERTIDLAAMLLRLAEGSAPTVEALIREAVREALTDVEGRILAWADSPCEANAAEVVTAYRDEHYPEGEA